MPVILTGGIDTTAAAVVALSRLAKMHEQRTGVKLSLSDLRAVLGTRAVREAVNAMGPPPPPDLESTSDSRIRLLPKRRALTQPEQYSATYVARPAPPDASLERSIAALHAQPEPASAAAAAAAAGEVDGPSDAAMAEAYLGINQHTLEDVLRIKGLRNISTTDIAREALRLPEINADARHGQRAKELLAIIDRAGPLLYGPVRSLQAWTSGGRARRDRVISSCACRRCPTCPYISTVP